MPALFFPNLDALRLALASGLVPTAITSSPARAGFDEHGRLWLEPDELLSREALVALGRLGVLVLGSAGVPTQPARCWAELLPLRRTNTQPPLVLFDVPVAQLAGFVANLRRLRAEPVGIRLLSEPNHGRAWVTITQPPFAILLKVDDPDSDIRSYHQQTLNVWTARGWEHPLASQLAVPPGSVLLCDPERGVTCYLGTSPEPQHEEIPLRRHEVAMQPTATVARIDIHFRLVASNHPRTETLWLLAPRDHEAFRDFCRGADERLLRRFEIATVAQGAEARLLVRRASSEDGGAILPVFTNEYQPDPRLPSLYLPAGYSLRPRIRVHELARELRLSSERLTWLETDEGGIAIHTVPSKAFQPLCDHLEYTAPLPVSLKAGRPREDVLGFTKFVLRVDAVEDANREEVVSLDEELPQPTSSEGESSWVKKSVGRMMRWVRGSRAHGPTKPDPPPHTTPPTPEKPRKGKPSRSGQARADRVEQKLSSADILLHGHDRAARRHELESRLLADFRQLGPDQRAARWAELASVYSATGQSLDAAVCWLNAIWECPTPPTEWLRAWSEAECHLPKRSERSNDLDRWLGEPGRAGTCRVVAALAAHFGFQPTPPPQFVAALPRVLAVLEQQLDDIPVRAAWLARLAVARSCDGDTLGLARWRDRLIHRLHDRGPGLDLDEPSFLRFRGTATADRFHVAREWLTNIKIPVVSWVKRHAGSNGLEWAGLDGEGEATAAYAQFMLAWGLGALGERTRSRDWAARARKSLATATGPRADPAGHALLGDLFLHRIKDAHEGRQPKPGLPVELQERYDKLPEFARYSVDRLREHCQILQPLNSVRAYNGRDLKEIWGTDRLGERLSVLGTRADLSQLNDEGRALLAVAAAEPTTSTVPRITFALLEVAACLDGTVLGPLLDLVPTALNWMETWVQAGRWSDTERMERVARFQARMIAAAFVVAPAHAAEQLMQHLTRAVTSGQLLPAVTVAAPRVFRAARKFGLIAEAESLMRLLDPARGEWGNESLTAERVGLAVGWYAAGDEDAGHRILDAVSKQLFLAATTDLPKRTAVALAYAEALGFAPAIALERLKELFQRLDRVTASGSTNCYFTLQPLRFIDTVVRSVVTDEFTLGATVRAWLDEDEFLIRRRIHREMAALLRESESE